MHVSYLPMIGGATLVSVRSAAVQDSFDSSSARRNWCRFAGSTLLLSLLLLDLRVQSQLSQSRCPSLLLAKSSRVYLFFPPRGYINLRPPSVTVCVCVCVFITFSQIGRSVIYICVCLPTCGLLFLPSVASPTPQSYDLDFQVILPR